MRTGITVIALLLASYLFGILFSRLADFLWEFRRDSMTGQQGIGIFIFNNLLVVVHAVAQVIVTIRMRIKMRSGSHSWPIGKPHLHVFLFFLLFATGILVHIVI